MTKEQFDKTKQLTLERRKEVLTGVFKALDMPIKGLSPLDQATVANELETMGYCPKMFALAYRLLLSEQDRVRQ